MFVLKNVDSEQVSHKVVSYHPWSELSFVVIVTEALHATT